MIDPNTGAADMDEATQLRGDRREEWVRRLRAAARSRYGDERVVCDLDLGHDAFVDDCLDNDWSPDDVLDEVVEVVSARIHESTGIRPR